MIIPADQYKKIIKSLPIVCVDIVIQNEKGQILLIKRNTEPLKGEWWVNGGRILKGESVIEAAKRKAFEEIGLTISNLEFIGIYEDQFEQNAFNVNCQYHTISLVYKTIIKDINMIKLNKYSKGWKWSKFLPTRFIIQK